MPLDKPLNLDFESQPAQPAVPHQPEAQAKTAGNEQPLSQQLDELKKELQAKNKILDAKNQEISELKIKNRQLNDTNNDIQARQKLLEEELGKAEAQIELIQELLLSEEQAEAVNNLDKGSDTHE